EGVKRFRGLADRQPNWRSQSYLYRYNLAGGDRRRLTAGELSTALNGISPDGTKLLVGRTLIDYKVRPYSQTELSVLDLETGQSVIVWTGSWLADAQWAPDGKSLLLLGGPSLFGDKGVKVAKGIMPNEYDIEAFLFDLHTKQIEPLTKDFDPSVDQAYWSAPKDVIYFLTTDRAGRRLYRCRLADKAFQRIPAKTEVIEQLSIARTKAAAAFIGSEPNLPPKAYVLDLESAAVRLLSDPGAGDAADPKFGRVEPWTFRNKRGVVIDGLVYYPRDFDPAKKYPCIVNYYGGTTPTTSQFGGRYPKELYAAQGYAVYVLQPSGAIGYGQNFSALHVNDWGMIVADEIIDGVKKFLAEHPWVDSRRVGCIGASYGGFMTELILTRTNLFAAAISHAGISSIAGYWGEGFSGYSYSAVATANSFPWNRPDIYINQSPLYSANKITTPLLLLHGASDTNVPPGESAQMYTALKLLGREVEFVQILDQDHLILTYNKRIVWLKTILSWFDKWLKRQPEWWNDLYPQK
ncbi:MAG: prolyl oligopeptidase family serine peptidase, partial [Candidatus Aminicenantes bacterium]|nr:prolyl oligopeptidase family serine peptidase [Candidatus Aminicenantes bacterium]